VKSTHPSGHPAALPADSFPEADPRELARTLRAAGLPATGRFRQLESVENRAYGFEVEGRGWVMVKLYRPGRWSCAAILEEHRFVLELARAGLPVVAPLAIAGRTLGRVAGLFYAVHAWQEGDEPGTELDEETLDELGAAIARMHAVGAAGPAPSRPLLTPEACGQSSLDVLVESGLVPADLRAEYERRALRLLERLEPRFTAAARHRIHGDLHAGNLLRTAGGLRIVDFDDFCVGPPAQDLWLIARGADGEVDPRRLGALVRAYRRHRALADADLDLVLPLRALRVLWAAAWIAARWRDPALAASFPRFRTRPYWVRQLDVLDAWSRRLDQREGVSSSTGALASA
jgi:Ser/Thr protein kinase RdoA (MazF antagonist)